MERAGTMVPVTVSRRAWEIIDKSTGQTLPVLAGEASAEGNQLLLEQNGILKVGTQTATGIILRDGSSLDDVQVVGILN